MTAMSWARHPGLVEELWALRAWRLEVYSGGQPAGQAARYWHTELRQLVQAAVPMYAAGCRTGHRGASMLAADDPEQADANHRCRVRIQRNHDHVFFFCSQECVTVRAAGVDASRG